jgi:serine/threonine-protein phosphatase 5
MFCDQIILAVRKLMLETPSLVDIAIPQNSKLTVCGDVHGRLNGDLLF